MKTTRIGALLRISLLSLTLIPLIAPSAKAQDYFHAAGLGISSAGYSISYDGPGISYTGNSSIDVPGVFYKATYTLGDQFAVSAYPFLGLSFSGNSRTGGSGAFGIELPVNAEIYFGEFDDKAFFGGLGFAYAYSTSTFEGSGSIFGPQIALGGQTYYNDQLLGARIAFAYGLNGFDFGPDYTIHSQSRYLITLGIYYSFDGY